MDASVVASVRHPVYPVAGPGSPGFPDASHTDTHTCRQVAPVAGLEL